MPKVNLIVEGQTEETFVNSVLSPFITARNPTACVLPIVVQTKRVYSGGKWRGGITKYRHFKDDVRRALGDSGARAVSSMIDLFHMPSDFPKFSETVGRQFRERVVALEEALRADIGDERFLPYISTHEFEALVLSRPDVLCDALGAEAKQKASFTQHINSHASPESINGENPPSYRIEQAFPAYDKIRHGSIAAQEIGIDSIATKCEHFAEWLSSLEMLLTDR